MASPGRPDDRAMAIRLAAQNRIIAQAEAQLKQGILKAYRAAIKTALSQARDIYTHVTEDEDGYRERMFRRLGELGQQAMVRSYDQLVTRREGPASASHYRRGQGRLAGGILRQALSNGSFFTATADGLNFGDTNFLDAEAAHWHRINFGAGARGAGDAVDFPVSFGASVGTLGLEEGPSPGFALPPGVWLGPNGHVVRHGAAPRGADQFFPGFAWAKAGDGGGYTSAGSRYGLNGTIRRSKIRSQPAAMRPTQGIEAANFMNAGIAKIAQNIPDLYRAYVEDLIEGSIRASSQRRRAHVVQGPVAGTLYKLDLP